MVIQIIGIPSWFLLFTFSKLRLLLWFRIVSSSILSCLDYIDLCLDKNPHTGIALHPQRIYIHLIMILIIQDFNGEEYQIASIKHLQIWNIPKELKENIIKLILLIDKWIIPSKLWNKFYKLILKLRFSSS
jgi:hypothetical protein